MDEEFTDDEEELTDDEEQLTDDEETMTEEELIQQVDDDGMNLKKICMIKHHLGMTMNWWIMRNLSGT
jgi:hypothetical protein